MLRYSGRKRDLARSERAAALARVNALEAELGLLEDLAARFHASLAGPLRRRASELQLADARKAWFEREGARLKRQIHEASLILQEKDRALRRAQRERRKFELLRSRRQAAWLIRQGQLEQKQLDEIASQGRWRGSSCPGGRQT